MTVEQDAYWDELGIAWRALQPDQGLVVSRLEPALRLQAALVRLGAFAGYPAGVLGLALAGWCLWTGLAHHAWSFVARGSTIAVVALMALSAAGALQAGLKGERGSLRQMLELASLRAGRLARAAGLGVLALAVLAAGGLAGYAIRARFSRPPAVSSIEDLLAVGAAAVAMAWIWSSQSRAQRKYRHLARALFAEDLAGA